MDTNPAAENSPRPASGNTAELLYAGAMFTAAALVLAYSLWNAESLLPEGLGTGAVVFFVCYGLFTIAIGYRHPNSAYYSFDRVSQVASILVLGPLAAAAINGLASFIYPWHRLWKGTPLRHVLVAVFNNSGLMALIIFASGYVYTAVGGHVPLVELDMRTIVALLALVLTLQLLNELGYAGLVRVGRRRPPQSFSLFAIGLELGSALAAILVALVYSLMAVEVFVLLLLVLSLGMLALRQFADMRYKLEAIVDERTRSLREKTLELEKQATQDKLTGLFNRRYADAYLEQQLEHALRYRQHFTIALADLDRFKQINDLYSHAMGDEVLQRVARILRERCRRTDMVSRYGGEEFLICFPETDIRRASAICEQLRIAIENEPWSGLDLGTGVTVSFGLAERRSDSSRESLLNAADLRLYAAKNSGRNLVIA